MKSFSCLLIAGAICINVLVGCGRGTAAGPSASETQAFDKAPPEIKQTWVAALEASKTNDYVTAQTLLFGLLRQQPTPEQNEAIQKQITSSRERLTSAAAKGDPAAQAALQQLRQNPPNRQR